ncbi:GIY-YIG nuclease family protein [Amphritea sp. HPY]|uniref:GIY-YIG nuclease family protein n=1 Tax=Amphritea sp. HPY TaxID=3421652 RepID=UPI003D7F0F36
MIIFTITNSITDQVYVGSTRDSTDSRWEQILVAAETGLEHPLYTDIREHNPQNFIISEWAIAEDLQDLRELTKEAIETFSAIGLQGLRTSAPVAKPTRAKPKKKEVPEEPSLSEAAANIFASRNALENDSESALDDLDSFDGLEFSGLDKETDKESDNGDADAVKSAPVKPVEQEKSLTQMAEDRDKQLAGKIAKERAEALEMAKLMARVDARRRSPKSKAASAKKAAGTAKTKAKTATSSAPKLSSGKVGSATQERKIREAIEQEKEQRQAEKLAQQQAESKEMAELMARIDSRGKPAAKAKAKPKAKKTLSLKTTVTSQPASSAAARTPDVAAQPALADKIPARNMERVLEHAQQATVERPSASRFSTALRERKIRDTIAREKSQRIQQQQSQQSAQADQLNALQARLAARAASKQ